MKGGILNRLVISPLVALTIFFTFCFFVLGGPATASFAKVTTTALGFGAGATLGSLPNLFSSMKDGQSAVGGGGSGGTEKQQADRQRSADRQANGGSTAKPDTSTGNRSNDGTD